MTLLRKCGILLHPTSFEGTPGIGTLGDAAYKFVDWLSAAGQSLWQLLPLGPTGYGDSPYASFSTFAGNPLLIDLDLLLKKGWAPKKITAPLSIKNEGKIDFGATVLWKFPILDECADFFQKNCADKKEFNSFKRKNSYWLDDYAAFMSAKTFFDKKAANEKKNGVWFNFWPKDLVLALPSAVKKWRALHSAEIERIKIIQFFFESQWRELKKYANAHGIQIIGDIPIFVAPDSADVWANQNLFQLKKSGEPKRVAGVPPDYFSATGQLWGNPLYDWAAMKKAGYEWWIARIRRNLELADYVRIDHFRAFEAYWSIPFGEKTAINGKWVPGPKKSIFRAIKKSLGAIPVIAEDLGVITKEVRALKESADFPGMKVLQFAFGEEALSLGMTGPFLPHMYEKNCVAYTGTHDNDTLQGWLFSAPCAQAKLAAEYAFGKPFSEKEVCAAINSGELRKALIRATIASAAHVAIIPLQDILGCASEGRMNTPGAQSGNWVWRFPLSALTTECAERLAFLCKIYGRVAPLSQKPA